MFSNWKQSLDRYLTSSPEDSYIDNWFDTFFEGFSEDFFEDNEEWVLDEKGQCDKWAWRLYNDGYTPDEASRIIERSFKVYKL